LDIKEEKLAMLSPQQQKIQFDLPVSKGGRYALVLEYFTPQGANLSKIGVESTSRKGRMSMSASKQCRRYVLYYTYLQFLSGMSKGEALIYNCKMATLCRQVVTTPDGEVAIFRFDQSSINVVLESEPDSNERVAVHSITAIPLGKWSLDQIRPKDYCIVKNGTCIASNYLLPPDSTKIEAESSDPERIAPRESMPDGVTDKNLILLDKQKQMVEISGKVPNPGYYTFLVHYHQPDNPEFLVEVTIKNGQHYMARLPVVHCPSTAGCRSQVIQDDKNARFYIQDNFMFTLGSTKNVWIDYVLATPVDDESTELQPYLEQSPLDETRKFIAECGKNHFHLKLNATGFCRDAVFSLTSDYNNGALPCQCDFYGSTAFECEEFGGQCPCKEYVIGRRCERCKTGYFGFPTCKPCDCPSTAFCDPLTGIVFPYESKM
jgi:laminin alpha 3/5